MCLLLSTYHRLRNCKKKIPIFKQARYEGKKASWKIEGDECLLYVDGVRI